MGECGEVMVTMTIWWVAIFLEGLLLVRGFQQKLFRQYPFFYSYILFVFLEEFLRFIAYHWDAKLYFKVYWSTQYLSLVVGSTVIFELYRIGLRAYPGTARMARASLSIVFAVIFVKVLENPTLGLFPWLAFKSEQLERSLRVVQASALLVLVAMCIWYAIPFGRNLKGIVYGYGLFISMSVLQLTAASRLWNHIGVVWSYIQPCSYLMVLGIWVGALWNFDHVAESRPDSKTGGDYGALADSTRGLLEQARARMGSAVRP